MSTTSEQDQGPVLGGYESGRCSRCGGEARLWPDRWYCTQCNYFDLVRGQGPTYRDTFGEVQETEGFHELVEKAHFWARHAMGTSGAHKAESLSHAAMCMSRALRILAHQLQGQ